MTKPRILVGGDDRLFTAGLEQLLVPEFDVVATTEILTSVPDVVRRLRPDVVVQGLPKMPHVGVEVIRRTHASSPATRIVVITERAEAALVADAFREGASAYVSMASTAADLLTGVRAALSGASYVPGSLAGAVLASLTHRPELTPSEREVVRLCAAGKGLKEVAAALGVTTSAVTFRKYRVMRKLAIKNSAELVRFAMKHGLV